MSVSAVRFKRMTVNRVISAKQNSTNETTFWAQYFYDSGELIFQMELSFEEALKLDSSDYFTKKLTDL